MPVGAIVPGTELPPVMTVSKVGPTTMLTARLPPALIVGPPGPAFPCGTLGKSSMAGLPFATVKVIGVADDASKLASPEYAALAECVPTDSAGVVQLAFPVAFNGTVAIVESIVKVLLPVANTSVMLGESFIPVG